MAAVTGGADGARAALSLLNEMKAKGFQPTVRALNAAVKSCEDGG